MEIEKIQDKTSLIFKLSGRLDTLTSPLFETELKHSLDGITNLTLDLAQLDYVSSAGLRVLLSAQKLMAKQGKMLVIHVNPSVMEVFEMTGFTTFLSIE